MNTAVEKPQSVNMVYKLHDQPPVGISLLVALQHLLAVFGGILTAPLVIALGMGLSIEQTSYLISSALVVSGFATAIQILRAGPFGGDVYVGSGLLSIQGTSFAFIGPLIFAYQTLVAGTDSDTALGLIFGSCAVCALIMMVLSQFIGHLRKIVTSNVTGATIILLGFSLVWVTLQNLQREYQSAGEQAWLVVLLAGSVFGVILLVSQSKNTWLRLCSISIGLLLGLILSFSLGAVDTAVFDEIETLFLPMPWNQPLAVDWPTVLLLMPIFLVSATESVGDFTATSDLSGIQVGDDSFWQRIKSGVLGDSINSFLAAIFCTFPNTTFSQNNGVIRLT
jgi:NCS2 family nucleobase:cation symporter-2/xanthine permease XanP